MPGPPPPPPPGGLPPPPMPSMLPPKGGGSDDRAALLKSIQRGARLKKAVTNDRSAPAVAGGNSGGKPANAQSPSQQAPNGLNLGGLFAGGMPKLRATGKPGASTLKNSNNIDVTRKPEVPSQPVKTHASVQSELRKQMANDSRNRGPPPPAPVRSGFENGTKASHVNGVRANQSSLHSNSSTLHRREMSNTSLCSPDSTDSMNGINQHHNVKPVISHGKPNLAPKPPNLNGKPTAPPKKLLVNGKAISRAHSMKSPRSPSPQSPDANPAIKFGTVRNLSSVIGHSLANSTGNLSPRPRPMLNGRPNAPPPQVPSQQPPHGYSPQSSAPPPPSKTAVRPPNHAPPPPPTSLPQVPPHTPPPPPHRTLPTRAPPAVPGNAAPPPPPRHSSMTTHRKLIVDFEEKFKFNPSTTFPKPPPYRNVFKIYSSRQGSTC